MKIKYLTSLLVLLAFSVSCSKDTNKPDVLSNSNQPASPVASNKTSDESFDFRKAKWGMSRDEVKRSEDAKALGSESEMLGYKTELLHKDAYLAYAFVEDKLAVAMYQFRDLHSNKNDYFEDFQELKKVLSEKYGQPLVDEVEWKNNLYKDKPEDWGLAVAMGHLKHRAKWETDRTSILLLLYGEKYDITLMARYDSKEYRPLFDEQTKKKGKSVL